MAGIFRAAMGTLGFGVGGPNRYVRVRLIRDCCFIRAVSRFKHGELVRDFYGRTTQMFFIVDASLNNGSSSFSRFFRLTNSGVEYRSSCNVFGICDSTVAIDRPAFVRRLRRCIRCVKVHFFGFVRWGSEMKFAPCFLHRLPAFFVACMSKEYSCRAKCNRFFRVFARIGTSGYVY